MKFDELQIKRYDEVSNTVVVTIQKIHLEELQK